MCCVFHHLSVSLLKKVNSTQRFWFVLCISLFECFSFEKGKRYTEIFLCKRAKRKEIEIIFSFLSDTILKKVHSTQRFSCVLFTFFKHKNIISIFFFQRKISVYCLPFSKEYHTNTKILYQFHFLLLSFKKGKQYTRKSLCTVYLFQNSIRQKQKYYFNFFSLLFSRLG